VLSELQSLSPWRHAHQAIDAGASYGRAGAKKYLESVHGLTVDVADVELLVGVYHDATLVKSALQIVFTHAAAPLLSDLHSVITKNHLLSASRHSMKQVRDVLPDRVQAFLSENFDYLNNEFIRVLDAAFPDLIPAVRDILGYGPKTRINLLEQPVAPVENIQEYVTAGDYLRQLLVGDREWSQELLFEIGHVDKLDYRHGRDPLLVAEARDVWPLYVTLDQSFERLRYFRDLIRDSDDRAEFLRGLGQQSEGQELRAAIVQYTLIPRENRTSYIGAMERAITTYWLKSGRNYTGALDALLDLVYHTTPSHAGDYVVSRADLDLSSPLGLYDLRGRVLGRARAAVANHPDFVSLWQRATTITAAHHHPPYPDRTIDPHTLRAAYQRLIDDITYATAHRLMLDASQSTGGWPTADAVRAAKSLSREYARQFGSRRTAGGPGGRRNDENDTEQVTEAAISQLPLSGGLSRFPASTSARGGLSNHGDVAGPGRLTDDELRRPEDIGGTATPAARNELAMPGSGRDSTVSPARHFSAITATESPAPTDHATAPHTDSDIGGQVRLSEEKGWAETEQHYGAATAVARAFSEVTGDAGSAAAMDDLRGRIERDEIGREDAYVEAVGIAARGVVDAFLIPAGASLDTGQLTAIIAMARDGKISELISGGGKTLVNSVAAVVRALVGTEGKVGGDRVHLVAPNEGLASDLFGVAKKLGGQFGLTVGLNTDAMNTASRATNFAEADIVVGSKDGFRFAKLRTRNGQPEEGYRQPDYFVFDEVDYTHIDQAGVDARLAKSSG
jgi:hypothetical protein